MKISTEFEFEDTKADFACTNDRKVAIRNCHWCREELHGLLAEFVHCVKCNERRLIEGLDQTFDPCPICMTLKSKKWNFLSPDNEKNGDIIHD